MLRNLLNTLKQIGAEYRARHPEQKDVDIAQVRAHMLLLQCERRFLEAMGPEQRLLINTKLHAQQALVRAWYERDMQPDEPAHYALHEVVKGWLYLAKRT